MTSGKCLDDTELWDGVFVHCSSARIAMIEFAKYHVQKALKAASKNATMKVEYDDEAYQESNEYGQSYVSAHEVEKGGEYGGITIEAESILASYSLDNIVY